MLPGFTDSHVHFPTWALAQRDVKLDGCGSLAEALDRVRAHPREGAWLRGQGWRDADWPDGPPTAAALDAIVSDRPAMLISKDYHGLWLNSAALALAGGDLEVDGGVVVRDESGEPTGVLYEESAWRFKARFVVTPDDEYLAAMREGVRVAASRGVTALHDRTAGLVRSVSGSGSRRTAGCRSASGSRRRPTGCRTCASSGCAAVPGLPSSGSATSRRSWTGRSARRPRG